MREAAMNDPVDDPEARRLAAALAASQIGVFEYDAQTQQAFWDERVRQLWGIPEDEHISYETVVQQVHPDDRALHDTSTEQALDPAGNGEMDFEYRVLPRDGGPQRWVRARAKCTFRANRAVRLLGTVEDITERYSFQERNTLLVHELKHRVKNTLATVLSIIRLSKSDGTSVEEYVHALERRILSLSHSHGVMSQNNWQNIGLFALIEREFEAFVDPGLEILRYSGPNLQIPAHQVQILTMAIHELLNNALKHGALRDVAGHVNIETQYSDGTATLAWVEQGPLRVHAYEQPDGGFGSILLHKILRAELKATVSHSIAPQGAVFSLTFPLKKPNRP